MHYIKYFSKITLLFIFILCLQNNLFSQKQRFLPKNLPDYDDAPYHFGFTLSGLYSGFRLEPVDNYYNIVFPGDTVVHTAIGLDENIKITNMQPVASVGFSVGIVSNFRLNEYFDFRIIPGLSLTFRRVDLTFKKQGDDGNFYEYNKELMKQLKNNMTIECVYLDLPLLIKYKGKRIHNVRPYIIGGAEYKFDVLALAPKIAAKKDDFILTYPHDISASLGAGFDFYMFWFKFGVELRMTYGMLDILHRKLTQSLPQDCIKSLHSKHFNITFTFE